MILISIDTLRSDHLPAYGYTRIETPLIDRFRSEAILYEHTYTPCPMTFPAHVTMLTGMLPFEHGVRNNVGFTFDGSAHVILPRFLKEHRFAAGAAVSSYVLRSETGIGPLFDYYEASTDPRPGVAAVRSPTPRARLRTCLRRSPSSRESSPRRCSTPGRPPTNSTRNR